MPAVAGMQAKAVMHIVAVTPATSNSKDDINCMTATTVEMQATESYKTASISRDPNVRIVTNNTLFFGEIC